MTPPAEFLIFDPHHSSQMTGGEIPGKKNWSEKRESTFLFLEEEKNSFEGLLYSAV